MLDVWDLSEFLVTGLLLVLIGFPGVMWYVCFGIFRL